MAERWTVDPVVAGSTPVSHPAVVSGQEGLTTDHSFARVAQRIERRTFKRSAPAEMREVELGQMPERPKAKHPTAWSETTSVMG